MEGGNLFMFVPIEKQRGPRQRQVHLRIPRSEYYILKHAADLAGVSVAEYLSSFISYKVGKICLDAAFAEGQADHE